MDKVFKEMSNSQAKGRDNISNFILKKSETPLLKQVLLKFFNTMLNYLVTPVNLNISIIRPILKDQNKSSQEINNIRPISISNSLSQILEKLILIKSPQLLKTSRNQFGFKKHSSCQHAIFVAKETLANYIDKGSKVKAVSLDAEKAFDKLWTDGLFYKLHDKMEHDFWFLLKTYYDQSKAIININGNESDLFRIGCGVKQGGILSPYLFNIMIDDLLKECLDKNVGALYENINTCILAYADDILLISPNDMHLQILLDICHKYSVEWKIKFNPAKSSIIDFSNNKTDREFRLGSQVLAYSKEIKYLGIIIDENLDFNRQYINKFNKVQKTVFSLKYLGLKTNSISPFLQSFIYKTYCLSTFTYGFENATINKSARDEINVKQNNLIRQILGMKKFSHISKTLKALKVFQIEHLYMYYKLIFINNIKSNEICKIILNTIINESDTNTNIKNDKKSKSFKNDCKLLSNFFQSSIDMIQSDINSYIKKLKDCFINNDCPIYSSIITCFINYKSSIYRKIFRDITELNIIK